MHKLVGLTVGLAICTIVAVTAAAEQTDMQTLRKQAAHRHRRTVFDNDGNEPVYYCDTATRRALLDRRTSSLADSQADTIGYCTWSSGFSMFTHNTQVGEIFTCTAPEAGKGPNSGFAKTCAINW